jgi:hypothetical protein
MSYAIGRINPVTVLHKPGEGIYGTPSGYSRTARFPAWRRKAASRREYSPAGQMSTIARERGNGFPCRSRSSR